MRIYFIHKIVKQEKGENTSQETVSPRGISEDSFDAYKDDHKRLEALRDETETIWEDRTYQLSAGGLSLTFAVFSFLMKGQNGVQFHYPMAMIWGGFTFCLLINYLSHHISKIVFLKLQDSLYFDREKGLEYDEDRLRARYEKSSRILNLMNNSTSIVLVFTIILTIVYTTILFYNLN